MEHTLTLNRYLPQAIDGLRRWRKRPESCNSFNESRLLGDGVILFANQCNLLNFHWLKASETPSDPIDLSPYNPSGFGSTSSRFNYFVLFLEITFSSYCKKRLFAATIFTMIRASTPLSTHYVVHCSNPLRPKNHDFRPKRVASKPLIQFLDDFHNIPLSKLTSALEKNRI